MKHTPGPWEAQYEGVENRWAIGNWKTSNPFCFVPDFQRVEKLEMNEEEANARLIAAAPDLLQALKDLHREIWAHHKMNVKRDVWLLKADAAASKAIAKAEGGVK